MVAGIDRGVAVSAALSTGELLHAPGLAARERRRLLRLGRKLARARRGSNRRARGRLAIARTQKNSKYSRISQSLTSWPSGTGTSASALAYRPSSWRFIMTRYETSVSPNAFR